MQRAPKVSVVIPVYNVEEYLRQCLDSVLNQTLREIEVVCVDDGSTDGSAAILAEYAAKDPRIRVLSRAHANAGAARNAGMAEATGEWLFFSDADDFSGAEMLSRMVTAEGADSADIVIAGHRTLEAGAYTANRLPPRLLGRHEAECGPCLFVDAGVMPWNKLFRRSFVQRSALKFQEVARHNDMVFVCCALAAAGGIAVSNTCGYVYRRGRMGAITGSAAAVGQFADVLLVLRGELERRGLFGRAAQAYGNLALAHCCYHLLGAPDAAAFSALYSALHGRILAALGLGELDEAAFANRKHLEYMKATLADETPVSLMMILLKERYSSWKELCSRNERISALRKKACEAEGETAALRGEAAALRKETDALKGEVAEGKAKSAALQGDIVALKREAAALKGEKRALEERLAGLEHQLSCIMRSASYRIGRFVTWPYRALRRR